MYYHIKIIYFPVIFVLYAGNPARKEKKVRYRARKLLFSHTKKRNENPRHGNKCTFSVEKYTNDMERIFIFAIRVRRVSNILNNKTA